MRSLPSAIVEPLALAAAGISCLVLAAWVANDSAHYHKRWYLWAALTLLTGPVGLCAWLVVRLSVRRQDLTLPARSRVAFSPVNLLIGSLVTLLLVSLGANVRVIRVTGNPMAPTYVDGDFLLVSAFSYQYRQPSRGDVALLYWPLDPNKLFVDRVLGREGDVIRIVDGRVDVNGATVNDDNYVPAEYRSHDDWGPQVVAQGYYFVMGDHRNSSSDSRHWGFVPKKYLWGRIVARVWPPRS
jgi:signal peptidase I